MYIKKFLILLSILLLTGCVKPTGEEFSVEIETNEIEVGSTKPTKIEYLVKGYKGYVTVELKDQIPDVVMSYMYSSSQGRGEMTFSTDVTTQNEYNSALIFRSKEKAIELPVKVITQITWSIVPE